MRAIAKEAAACGLSKEELADMYALVAEEGQ